MEVKVSFRCPLGEELMFSANQTLRDGETDSVDSFVVYSVTYGVSDYPCSLRHKR